MRRGKREDSVRNWLARDILRRCCFPKRKLSRNDFRNVTYCSIRNVQFAKVSFWRSTIDDDVIKRGVIDGKKEYSLLNP